MAAGVPLVGLLVGLLFCAAADHHALPASLSLTKSALLISSSHQQTM
jgi:hypothetical protein